MNATTTRDRDREGERSGSPRAKVSATGGEGAFMTSPGAER